MDKHGLDCVTNGYKSRFTGTTLHGVSLVNNPASISPMFSLLSLTSPLCTEHWSATCLCQRHSLLFHSFSFSLFLYLSNRHLKVIKSLLSSNLSSQTSFLFQLPAPLSSLLFVAKLIKRAICTYHHLASQEQQPPLPWSPPHLSTCSPP